MYTIKIKKIDRVYKNNGQHFQQCADFTLTNQIRKADHIPFDVNSDIPEFKISVKSSHFTLASSLNGDTKRSQIDDFFSRVHSTTFLYVTSEYVGYMMTAIEFKDFLMNFANLERSSNKKNVVRCKRETKKMLQYLHNKIIE